MSLNGLKLYTIMYSHWGYYHNEGIRIWLFRGGTVGQNVPFLDLLADLAWVTPRPIFEVAFMRRTQCLGIRMLR